ncbi:MAG: dihydropteroate synthase [Sphingomonadales bacterium]|nr:dihydropteroate synthase [Sphingomonadales bacterium]
MTGAVYIRPIGRLGLSSAASRPPATLHVAGRTDLSFAAAEVIERVGGFVRRRIVAANDLPHSDAAGRGILQRLQRQRPAIAGLALDRPRIMGVVNVTPDSFSDGGRYLAADAAIAHGLRLEAEGADILDIGGESTRPGAEPISIEDECRRVLPVIEGLAKRSRAPLSIDTRNAEVMRRAAQVGARIINDVSALAHDPQSLEVAAATGLPVVLMHAQGDPRIMQRNPAYDDVVLDVYDALNARIAACAAAGIPIDRLIVDPGIGFGKTLAHNLALLGALTVFHGLGCPVLLGASRKSFIGKLTGAMAEDRLPGSLAAALLGAAQGVQILRVHDVAATRQALAVWDGALRSEATT